MTETNREGWVPICLKRDGPAVFVDWCWLGRERFTAPFFDTTIDIALRKPFNMLFTHRTPIAELGEWHAVSPGMAPAGFIFHMSRCGSTLVSQMLAAMPETIMISEAFPVDWLARASWAPEADRADWLRWMVSALGQKRAGSETRYFIKFDSPTVAALPFIRRVFPDVPWIFLYRNPEEVLASHLREPAAAMAPGFITDGATIDAPLTEILSMSAEEYAARVIGRICECARCGMDGRGLLVNYLQLPRAVHGEIARHFDIEISAHDLVLLQEAATHDAKRPHRKFEPDSEQKLQAISPSARAAAGRWILPHYEALERLRLDQLRIRDRRDVPAGIP